MAQAFIIIELILVFFYSMSKHDSQKHPRAYIEPIQPYVYLPSSLSNICEVWPVKLFITSPNYSVGNSEQVAAGVDPENILSFNFPGFGNRLLRLLIILFRNNIQFVDGIGEGFLFIFQLVCCPSQFVAQLFVLLLQFVKAPRILRQFLLQYLDLCLLCLNNFAILIFFSLHKCVKLGVIHKHLLFYFGKRY